MSTKSEQQDPPQSTVDSSEPTDAQLTVEKELDRLDVLRPGHIEIANLLVRAKNSSARNLESKLAELRARRQVGSGNIYMGDVMLDNTVILLVQGNNLGIAKSLISSSIRETNVLMENKIYQTVKDPKQAERVVDQIHQLHADKQREFREKLTACGVDLDFQKAILDSNFDPDAALDISIEFCFVFISLPAF